MVEFNCPRDGKACRGGCPAVENVRDWATDQNMARRLTGKGGQVTQREVDDQMGRTVFKRRPIGSRGKGIGDMCGRSGQPIKKR